MIVKELTAFALSAGLMLFATTVASGEEARFEIKAASSIRSVLSENVGKRVAVKIGQGEEIEGTVVMVGNELVHLSKITGKDFFDSAVRIDTISAVRIRVRDR